MFIESIKFKREQNSEWEKGFYVGETDSCENSVILDEKYQPLETAWNYETDITNWIHIRC